MRVEHGERRALALQRIEAKHQNEVLQDVGVVACVEGVAIIHRESLAAVDCMARVLGVGGVFFKSRDSDAMLDWYRRVLGIEFTDWGGALFLPEAAAAHPGAATVFSPFKHDTDYF